MAAIHWMVERAPEVDLHTVLKTCYFADKAHLNKHGRPIFGASYWALRFGPVPWEIYEMIRGEALWLPEIEVDRYPWRLDGYRLRLQDNQAPDLAVLSASDFREIEAAFAVCRGMKFDARTAATHAADWQAAELGQMNYEDMLEDTDAKIDIVDYLRENARFMRL